MLGAEMTDVVSEVTKGPVSEKSSFSCDLCYLDFTSFEEQREHEWSLVHHQKLDKKHGRDYIHTCGLCKEDLFGLLSYVKHIQGISHKKALVSLEDEKNPKQLPTLSTIRTRIGFSNEFNNAQQGRYRDNFNPYPRGPRHIAPRPRYPKQGPPGNYPRYRQMRPSRFVIDNRKWRHPNNYNYGEWGNVIPRYSSDSSIRPLMAMRPKWSIGDPRHNTYGLRPPSFLPNRLNLGQPEVSFHPCPSNNFNVLRADTPFTERDNQQHFDLRYGYEQQSPKTSPKPSSEAVYPYGESDHTHNISEQPSAKASTENVPATDTSSQESKVQNKDVTTHTSTTESSGIATVNMSHTDNTILGAIPITNSYQGHAVDTEVVNNSSVCEESSCKGTCDVKSEEASFTQPEICRRESADSDSSSQQRDNKNDPAVRTPVEKKCDLSAGPLLVGREVFDNGVFRNSKSEAETLSSRESSILLARNVNIKRDGVREAELSKEIGVQMLLPTSTTDVNSVNACTESENHSNAGSEEGHRTSAKSGVHSKDSRLEPETKGTSIDAIISVKKEDVSEANIQSADACKEATFLDAPRIVTTNDMNTDAEKSQEQQQRQANSQSFSSDLPKIQSQSLTKGGSMTGEKNKTKILFTGIQNIKREETEPCLTPLASGAKETSAFCDHNAVRSTSYKSSNTEDKIVKTEPEDSATYEYVCTRCTDCNIDSHTTTNDNEQRTTKLQDIKSEDVGDNYLEDTVNIAAKEGLVTDANFAKEESEMNLDEDIELEENIDTHCLSKRVENPQDDRQASLAELPMGASTSEVSGDHSTTSNSIEKLKDTICNSLFGSSSITVRQKASLLFSGSTLKQRLQSALSEPTTNPDIPTTRVSSTFECGMVNEDNVQLSSECVTSPIEDLRRDDEIGSIVDNSIQEQKSDVEAYTRDSNCAKGSEPDHSYQANPSSTIDEMTDCLTTQPLPLPTTVMTTGITQANMSVKMEDDLRRSNIKEVSWSVDSLANSKVGNMIENHSSSISTDLFELRSLSDCLASSVQCTTTQSTTCNRMVKCPFPCAPGETEKDDNRLELENRVKRGQEAPFENSESSITNVTYRSTNLSHCSSAVGTEGTAPISELRNIKKEKILVGDETYPQSDLFGGNVHQRMVSKNSNIDVNEKMSKKQCRKKMNYEKCSFKEVLSIDSSGKDKSTVANFNEKNNDCKLRGSESTSNKKVSNKLKKCKYHKARTKDAGSKELKLDDSTSKLPDAYKSCRDHDDLLGQRRHQKLSKRGSKKLTKPVEDLMSLTFDSDWLAKKLSEESRMDKIQRKDSQKTRSNSDAGKMTSTDLSLTTLDTNVTEDTKAVEEQKKEQFLKSLQVRIDKHYSNHNKASAKTISYQGRGEESWSSLDASSSESGATRDNRKKTEEENMAYDTQVKVNSKKSFGCKRKPKRECKNGQSVDSKPSKKLRIKDRISNKRNKKRTRLKQNDQENDQENILRSKKRKEDLKRNSILKGNRFVLDSFVGCDLIQHFRAVTSLKTFGHYLFSTSLDGTVRIFNRKNGRTVKCLKETKAVNCLEIAVIEREPFLLYGGDACRLMKIRLKNLKTHSIIKFDDRITAIHVAFGNLYVGLADGTLSILSAAESQVLKENIKCHYGNPSMLTHIVSAKYRSKNQLVLTAGYDYKITYREAKNGDCIRIIDYHRDYVLCLQVSRNWVFSCSMDCNLVAHSLGSGDLLSTYPAHPMGITVCRVIGPIVITCCLDGLIRCFEIKMGKMIQVYVVRHGQPFCFHVSDNLLGYVGTSDGRINAFRLNLCKYWICKWRSCHFPIGEKSHLQKHLENHLAEEVTSCDASLGFQPKCQWDGCPKLFSYEYDEKEIEKHAAMHVKCVKGNKALKRKMSRLSRLAVSTT